MHDDIRPRIPAGLDRPGLIAAMQACPQTPTLSVLDHGHAVWARFQELLAHLTDGAPLAAWWRVPGWARTPGLLDRLAPLGVLEEYQVHHDCVIRTPGKPVHGHRTASA